jgi:mRNA-degrading endonuclease RelE of RelBE toxin-antitoxin system
MEFRIADTFTDSLARLSGDEQKAVKTTAFDLQMNPAGPGMQFHRLDKAKDKNFWSVRVSGSIRLIVHRTEVSLLLCYVGHHDDAYQWAERRKLETHPKTGAAQLVEIRERVEEITIPKYIEVDRVAPPKPPLFAHVSNDELLSYGVPIDWLEVVRHANEDSILGLAEHLPSEAGEALLDLATGVTPRVREVVASAVHEPSVAYAARSGTDSFAHPDAQRRFRVISNVEELERALEYPWEKWTVFLHPAQRESVERDYGGPARVSGSAGTGKTVVALHRAVFLARTNPDARVLLTTFSDTLANVLRTMLRRLIGNEPRIAERLEVHALNAIARRLYERNIGRPEIASDDVVRQLLKESAEQVGAQKFSLHFLTTEWEDVVDAWQLSTWEAYRDVARLGRKTRLPEKQRQILWAVFERVRAGLKSRGLITNSDLLSKLASHLARLRQPPFEFAVVDEAQDVSVAQLRFLAALGAGRPNGLFFAGDLGQRIFQQPFSWKALGIDIRGRSKTLRINYRTSHQIRMQADRLLGPQVTDVDGNVEDRRGTISVFNGPPPTIKVLDTPAAETETASRWLKDRIAEGVKPHEIGVFVRSPAQLGRACAAMEKAELPFKVLDDNVETTSGYVSIGTMHLAKGLEFRAVAVMACDDEILPLRERIETVTDDSDLEEVYNTERHLLYVACTRARDHLLVTSVHPASEFLDDLKG